MNEVTQLLSTKNLKEIVGKNELVRSKLLEELNSLSFQLEVLELLQLTTEVLFFLLRIFPTPLPYQTRLFIEILGGKRVP